MEARWFDGVSVEQWCALLRNCANLKSLQFDCVTSTDYAMRDRHTCIPQSLCKALLDAIPAVLKNLHYLGLPSFTFVTQQRLECILQNCSKLRAIEISVEAFRSAVSKCTSLQLEEMSIWASALSLVPDLATIAVRTTQ
jgi:hypothetical protein